MTDEQMKLVTKYMIEHDCKLDEAIAAVSKQAEAPRKPRKPRKKKAPAPAKEEAKTKIKEVRQGSGMSQSQLAGAVGMNVRTLQAYEQGYRKFDSVPLKVLLQTVLALGCEIENVIEDPECIQLLKEYRGE